MNTQRNNSPRSLIWAAGLTVCVVLEVSGQDKPQVQTDRPQAAKPQAAERPSPRAVEKPARPVGRPETLSEMKQQLQKFDSARDSYLAKQRELSDRLRGATLEQKKEVQTQLETLRRDWFERARAYREEAQRRVPDLKDLPRFEALGRRPHP